jgi:glycosyltransferase involved in cell wall biosynthesis
MKIAVIDQLGNYGGVSRVIKNLLPALKEIDGDLEINYFSNFKAVKREKLLFYLEKKNIKITYLQFDWLASSKIIELLKLNNFIIKFQTKFRKILSFLPIFISGNLQKELEKRIKNYDLALFPWPFLINLPNLKCPIVGIFHDFNYKYYFAGQPTYFPNQLKHLNKNVPLWLKNTYPVVSNNFIKNEVKKFYPEFYKKTNVINLGPYSAKIANKNKKKKIKEFKFKYILCPTNLCGHKNLGILLVAFNKVSKIFPKLKLVLTGPYTDLVNGKSSVIGLELVDQKRNIIGLGYVADDLLENLISNSLMVLSPSVYEADNGPCTDAWYHSVPVAMANIPSNLEHIKNQKVHASLFDPYDYLSVSNAIIKVLKKYKYYKQLSKISKKNISQNYTWVKTASAYYELFKKINDYKKLDKL